MQVQMKQSALFHSGSNTAKKIQPAEWTFAVAAKGITEYYGSFRFKLHHQVV